MPSNITSEDFAQKILGFEEVEEGEDFAEEEEEEDERNDKHVNFQDPIPEEPVA